MHGIRIYRLEVKVRLYSEDSREIDRVAGERWYSENKSYNISTVLLFLYHKEHLEIVEEDMWRWRRRPREGNERLIKGEGAVPDGESRQKKEEGDYQSAA